MAANKYNSMIPVQRISQTCSFSVKTYLRGENELFCIRATLWQNLWTVCDCTRLHMHSQVRACTVSFHTPPHDSGGVLWFHIGRPCVQPSVVRSVSVCPFSFPDDILSIHQWIFTKLGVCIDIMEVWFGIANGQIAPNFYGVICPRCPYFRFRMITLVNINGFSPNLVCALILCRSGLGLLMGKFRQILTEFSAWDTPIFSFSRR